MTGFYFNFDENDIQLTPAGGIRISNTDGQCCALIAVSEICRITQPQIGVRLASRIIDRHQRNLFSLIKEAEREVKRDGARVVKIRMGENEQMTFYAEYDN